MTSESTVRRGAMLALGCALFATGAGLILRLLGLSDTLGRQLAVVGMVVAAFTAVLTAVLRAWRDSDARVSWLLLGGASLAEGAWLLMAAAPALAGHALERQPAADVGHLFAVPFAVAALLFLPTPMPDLRTRLRSGLDAVSVAFAFGVLSYNFGLPSGVNNLGALQPVAAMALGTAIVAVLSRTRFEGGLSLPTLTMLTGGVLVVAVSDALAAMTVVHDGWSPADPFLALGTCGHVLLALSAMRPVGERDGMTALRHREQIAVLAPVAPLVPVAVVIGVSIVIGIRLSGITLVLFGLLGVTILASTVLARLDGLLLSRTLEHRVVERTLAIRTHEKWFRSLVQNSFDLITIVDPAGSIRYQTPSLTRMLGHDPADFAAKRFGDLLRPEDAQRLDAVLIDAALRPRSSQVLEFAMRDVDGGWRETETVVTSLIDDPDIRGMVLNTRDVSERKELERQLTKQAFSDPLTGLANRALFRNRVEHAVAERSGLAKQVAVLFLDLDGFKAVNDAQGHAVGDRLLGIVAERLRRCVRPGDTVARLGGDEFAILVVGTDAESGATLVAERVRQVLNQPFVLDGRDVALAGSTGIAVSDSGDETAEQLLRNADLAMYRAKSARDGGYVRFEAQMHDALLLRVQAEADLRHALTRGQLALHYQPTVNLRTGRVVGVEALIRWYHPTRGIVQPMDFIGLAEETGLVESIGEWALRECCRQGVRWQAYAAPGTVFHIAVNVSSQQLTPRLPWIVGDALADSGLAPGALVIEMTESVLIDRPEEAIEVLRQLKALGTRIAVDDFGTGYSSLSYLSRFPVDILKIDKSFVEQCHERSEGAELARTIVRLGRSLRLGTVAEGIETREQYAALLEMTCDYGQGFLFSRPLPASGIDTLFAHLLANAAVPDRSAQHSGVPA